MYQQGDVIIKSVEVVPVNAIKKVKSKRGYVLAEGESSGHAHVVESEIELLEINGTLYIKAKEPFAVTHEEHGIIDVPAGMFEVGIVQEYDHFEKESRRVRD